MSILPNDLASLPPGYDPSQHMQTLQQGCQALNLALKPEQIVQFDLYYRQLVHWNQKFNLTAITEYEDVQTKHFLDCLAALPIIAEELHEAPPLSKNLHLVDVGTGAGFPGIPLKIANPHLQLTLVDGTGKKILFLREVVATLKLEGVQFVQGRAEELGRKPAFRNQFDLVTARAVAPMSTLAEYLLPLVRPNGLAIVYKGPGAPQEFVAARKAIDTLGGETVRLAPVQVPFLAEKRYVLLIKKVRPTPNLYPRGQGLARKKPLQ